MNMPNPVNETLRVAIIAKSSRQRLNLKSILEVNQLEVVPDDELVDFLSSPKGVRVADVLLVDLDENDDAGADELEAILENTELPILFNDGAATGNQYSTKGMAWGRRLAEKLKQLVESNAQTRQLQAEVASEFGSAESIDMDSLKEMDDAQLEHDLARHLAGLEKYERKLEEYDQLQHARSALHKEESAMDVDAVNQVRSQYMSAEELDTAVVETALNPACAQRIWVLGASIGGPQAVKEFLSCLPAGLPIALIVAQHIGKGFVPLLSEQLGRICQLDVIPASSGKVLRNNQLIVAPTDKKLVFNQAGELILRPQFEKTKYTPSIDLVLEGVAERFGPRAGAIIFSGMGDDGKAGVQAIARNRGVVWAQTAESCVISSMADHARDTGVVQFSGEPADLARRLVEFINRVS